MAVEIFLLNQPLRAASNINIEKIDEDYQFDSLAESIYDKNIRKFDFFKPYILSHSAPI